VTALVGGIAARRDFSSAYKSLEEPYTSILKKKKRKND
jgi:hypothetical protein